MESEMACPRSHTLQAVYLIRPSSALILFTTMVQGCAALTSSAAPRQQTPATSCVKECFSNSDGHADSNAVGKKGAWGPVLLAGLQIFLRWSINYILINKDLKDPLW